jgi:F420-dependent oxidoreductase-like protein
MAEGTIGISVQEPNPPAALAAIRRYEQAGVPAAWLTTGGIGPDGLTIFAAAAAQTERILLGTCIVPTYPRHPLVTVQQVSVIAALAPGRFRLGLGPSHKPAVEGTYGFEFKAPLGHLREYIRIVKDTLGTGAVDFDGRFYHAHGRAPSPAADVPVMASALRTTAFRLCGEIADGAITWVCPMPYVRDVALPALLEGAAAAGRPAPPMIAHAPFCLSDDADAARAAARQQLAVYPRLPYYAQMMVDAGLPEAAKGEWSDAMVDVIVAHGDEERVAAQLRGFLQAGASELIAAPIVVGDREQALARAAAFLAELAK